jgi:hypothetical protein
MTRRPRIVWDLDDTLNPLMRAWLGWFGREHPGTALPEYGALNENPPHALCGISKKGYLASLDRFRLSAEAAHMPVHPLILEWFGTRGHAFEHHVLTARPAATVATAADWVFRNLGTWVRHFHFVPAVRAEEDLPDAGSSKSSVIGGIGGCTFFLDDTAANFEGMEAWVEQCILVPQPWNRQSLGLEELLGQIR